MKLPYIVRLKRAKEAANRRYNRRSVKIRMGKISHQLWTDSLFLADRLNKRYRRYNPMVDLVGEFIEKP